MLLSDMDQPGVFVLSSVDGSVEVRDSQCRSCNLEVIVSSLSTRHKKLLLRQIWINLLISCLMSIVQKENNPVHLGLGVAIH